MMRRTAGLALAALALAVTSACGGSDSAGDDSKKETSKSSSTAEPSASAGTAGPESTKAPDLSGDRPSADDVSKVAQQGGGLSKSQADCASKIVVESDLSDEAVNAIVKGATTTYKPSAKDTKVLTDLQKDLLACEKK